MSTSVTLSEVSERLTVLENQVGHMFMYTCVAFILLLQPAFALRGTGAYRIKNLKVPILQIFFSGFAGVTCFYVIGWAFFGGPDGSDWVGHGEYALSDLKDPPHTYVRFALGFSYFSVCSAVFLSIVAERTTVIGSVVLMVFLSAFQYPILTHWLVDPSGWFAPNPSRTVIGTFGFLDFAGGAWVHALGASSGFAAALVCGPRIGRYNVDGSIGALHGHSSALQGTGALMMMVSWIPLNMARVPLLQGTISHISTMLGTIFVNTLLCGVGACLTGCALARYSKGKLDYASVINSIISGLVASSASAPFVELWVALILGLTTPFITRPLERLLDLLKCDDVTGSVPVHLAGIWGCIFNALLTSRSRLEFLYGARSPGYGSLYGGGAEQLLVQILGILVILAMGAFPTAAIAMGLRSLKLLRYSVSKELEGQDIVETGEPALELTEYEQVLHSDDDWSDSDDEALFVRPWLKEMQDRAKKERDEDSNDNDDDGDDVKMAGESSSKQRRGGTKGKNEARAGALNKANLASLNRPSLKRRSGGASLDALAAQVAELERENH